MRPIPMGVRDADLSVRLRGLDHTPPLRLSPMNGHTGGGIIGGAPESNIGALAEEAPVGV